MQEFTYKLIEDDTYCIMKYEGDEETVTVPSEYVGKPVTILYDDLFKGHNEIKNVIIPEGITDLGEFIFDGCENLHHIELPSTLKMLWGLTFVRSGLEEITLPDGIATIPPFCFKECKNLKKVVCGKGLKKIYAWAFGGCENLTELIQGPETEISPEAFMTKILNT